MVKVTAGSKWWGGDRHKFIVTNLKEVDQQTWIFYKNQETGQEYNCRIEAFLHRFMELPE